MADGYHIGPNERDLNVAGGAVVVDEHATRPGVVIARVRGVPIVRIVLPASMGGRHWRDKLVGGLMMEAMRRLHGPDLVRGCCAILLRAEDLDRDTCDALAAMREAVAFGLPCAVEGQADEAGLDTAEVADALLRWVPGGIVE